MNTFCILSRGDTAYSPTDEERNLEDSFSPSPPLRVQSLYSRPHGLSCTTEAPPSGPMQPKRYAHLPKNKLVQQTPTQLLSPGTSSNRSTRFVFCQQETQAPGLLKNTSASNVSHNASASCLTGSAEYSGDYSGGTGDSGVGDIRHKYTPSQEALDREFTLSLASNNY